MIKSKNNVDDKSLISKAQGIKSFGRQKSQTTEESIPWFKTNSPGAFAKKQWEYMIQVFPNILKSSTTKPWKKRWPQKNSKYLKIIQIHAEQKTSLKLFAEQKWNVSYCFCMFPCEPMSNHIEIDGAHQAHKKKALSLGVLSCLIAIHVY